MTSDYVMAALGPNPTQEHFCLAVYSATVLAFKASGEETLTWGEFVTKYDTVYLSGQPGLSNDPVAALLVTQPLRTATTRTQVGVHWLLLITHVSDSWWRSDNTARAARRAATTMTRLAIDPQKPSNTLAWTRSTRPYVRSTKS
jgi:hypothetical protein